MAVGKPGPKPPGYPAQRMPSQQLRKDVDLVQKTVSVFFKNVYRTTEFPKHKWSMQPLKEEAKAVQSCWKKFTKGR